jgi:MoaA/NifB/PqqE/SkfB family radical SAM enzyme
MSNQAQLTATRTKPSSEEMPPPQQTSIMAKKRFKIIYLELTNACNFTCDYCPIDQQTRKKVTMPPDFARNIIDQIAENNLTYFLTFHLMGEPFLHRDLASLTGYAEARGIRVRLLTNGSLLETKRNLALFANNLTRLEVGFRTPNDTSFSMRLRGGHLTLEEYVRRVKGLIDDKIRTRATTEVCVKLFIRPYGAALKIVDPYEHLTSKGDNLKLARLFQAHTLEAAKKYGMSTEEWEKVPVRVVDGEYFIFPGVSLAFSRIQDFWVREQRGQDKSKGYLGYVGGCSAGFRDDFGILATGEVTTCCVDYDGKNVIGDLRKQTLMEVLESAEAKRIKRSFQWFIPPTQFCRECRGGPTLISSVTKQASTIAIDVRDRISPRKAYRGLRKRLGDSDLP